MNKIARIGIGLAALGCAGGAAAQSMNQEISRHRAGKLICAQAYQERIERQCDAACLAAAAARQTKCLAGVEERYRAALRRQLRSRR